ncbi:MAG: acetamidase/formamidase [Paracoccaceae bacterium]|jgi:acetamidase/formamidase
MTHAVLALRCRKLRLSPLRNGLTKIQHGQMNIDVVRAGAILVCPVKVKGADVYMGNMHAGQGDGEIAGHIMSVAGGLTV